ncbi:hypothetical protein V5F38_13725, partial [Xanthobacter sp. V0B-10]|uniref:hypothetical protein n=1 Tax=Xanthobacter albus TaxID=3119929 RepID=UPI003729C4E3
AARDACLAWAGMMTPEHPHAKRMPARVMKVFILDDSAEAPQAGVSQNAQPSAPRRQQAA